MIAGVDARTGGNGGGVIVEDQGVEQLLSTIARAEEHQREERTKAGCSTAQHVSQSSMLLAYCQRRESRSYSPPPIARTAGFLRPHRPINTGNIVTAAPPSTIRNAGNRLAGANSRASTGIRSIVAT